MHNFIRLTLISTALLIPASAVASDPLPSWNDSDAKQAIVAFVEQVTDPSQKTFVPEPDRLAVFDNDGTLWPECPMPFELAFTMDEAKRLADAQPELARDPVIQAAINRDFETLFAGEKHDGFLKLMALTHAGISADEFKRRVNAWWETAKHPEYKERFRELAYQPMREVIAYLRSHGFKIAIVSGGGLDFMRVFAEPLYGVEPEWVLGSSADVTLEMEDGKPVVKKQSSGLSINDHKGKTKRIYNHLGRRPIAAFGNSDGDRSMMEYTTIDNPYPSFAMYIHHTDPDREYAYDSRPPFSGKLTTGLEAAKQHGWSVVDMKRDWNTLFSKPITK